MSDLEKFVSLLYDGLEGYAYSPVKTKTGSFVQHFFQLPKQRESLLEHIRESRDTGDVYLGPALYSSPKVSKDNVVSCRVAWAEYDGNTTIDLKGLKPSAVVQTSVPTHQHIYFRTDGNPAEIEKINRRLARFLSADTSGWDITQILRPPETRNYKQPKNWKNVKLLELNENVRAVFDRVPEIEIREPKDISVDELPLAVEVLNRAPSIAEYIEKKRPLIEDRSKHLVAVGYLMAENGFNEMEILSVLFHLDEALQKYTGRSNQLLILAQIAQQAVDKVVEREEEIVAQFEVFTIENLLKYSKEHDFIIDGWLPKGGLMILAGEPGVGKTQLGLQLGYCMSLGTEFLGKKIKSAKVGFLTLELPPEALKTFVQRQVSDPQKLTNMIVVKEPFDFQVSHIEAIQKIHGLDVMIIDSLSDLTIEELEESVSKKLFRQLATIRRRTGIALIIIHHIRKLQPNMKRKEITINDLYGSMIFGKESDAVIGLYETEAGLVLQEVKIRFSKKNPIVDVKRNDATLLYETMREVSDAVDNDSGGTGKSQKPPKRGF